MTSSEFRAEHSGFCRWTSHLSAKFAIYTPWKFNTASEILPCQKESSPPTIIFRGLCWTSVCECKLQYIENIACNVYIYIYFNVHTYIFNVLQNQYFIQNPPCCITTKTPRSDYTRRRLEVQMEVAMAQLELAKELQLPVILQATGRGKAGVV